MQFDISSNIVFCKNKQRKDFWKVCNENKEHETVNFLYIRNKDTTENSTFKEL